ncbi:CcdB family protein [Klebsiella pneumoniae]|uniref:CcdB family protein n=1 Tax=Klebsiella pneumoniae TaxID=573 RepID=UPI00115B3391|nr:CcdB family protein [Klebsiella pneumoniae]
MQYFVYRSTGKNLTFPFLIDVTSDIIGDINRRLVIPLMPAERLRTNHAPERLNPILTLVDGKEYVLMTHESATIPVNALGAEFCNVIGYRNEIKGALDFMLDGV